MKYVDNTLPGPTSREGVLGKKYGHSWTQIKKSD